jgi:hypothetical protein
VETFGKGDRVNQAQYGPGTITDTNSMHTRIEFDNHGLHTFVTRLVVLEATAEPAPVRAKGRRVRRSPSKAVTPSDSAPGPS